MPFDTAGPSTIVSRYAAAKKRPAAAGARKVARKASKVARKTAQSVNRDPIAPGVRAGSPLRPSAGLRKPLNAPR